jgi:hypothetical protein
VTTAAPPVEAARAPHEPARAGIVLRRALRCAVLCYAVLCCAALRCAALCCAVLGCAGLCCAALRCAALCCAVLCHAKCLEVRASPDDGEVSVFPRAHQYAPEAWHSVAWHGMAWHGMAWHSTRGCACAAAARRWRPARIAVRMKPPLDVRYTCRFSTFLLWRAPVGGQAHIRAYHAAIQ